MTHSFANNRARLAAELRALILDDARIKGAILVGSTATGAVDDYSDIDLYLYVDGRWWRRSELGQWLAERELAPDLHYWTGLAKHRVLIRGVRVDLSILPATQREELRWWPQLFFPVDAIFKDPDGTLVHAYRASATDSYRNRDNDYAAYVLNLLMVSGQFCRGEVINARSRLIGVLESRARLQRDLPLGSALWREPTRNIEDSLPDDQLRELHELAFLSSPAALGEWLERELRVAAQDLELTDNARAACLTRASQLARALASCSSQHERRPTES